MKIDGGTMIGIISLIVGILFFIVGQIKYAMDSRDSRETIVSNINDNINKSRETIVSNINDNINKSRETIKGEIKKGVRDKNENR